MFEGVQGVKIRVVTDGTSNTVLWPWPVMPFPGRNRASCRSCRDSRCLPWMPATRVATYWALPMAAVRILPRKRGKNPTQARSRACSGEVIMWPPGEGPAPTESRGTTSLPTPTPPPYLATASQPTPAPAMPSHQVRPPWFGHQVQGLEQRMRRVEDKLDRLLQKLDRLFPDGHPPQC